MARLPLSITPFGRERKRFEALRHDMGLRLRPSDRKELHDRVHGFLMGFSSLKGADGALAAMLLNDFLEAIEGASTSVVHRACRAWNQRKFTWANYSYPPNPPEFGRAVAEIRTEMQVEHYDIGLVLLAKPLDDPDDKHVPPAEVRSVMEQVEAALAGFRRGAAEARPMNEVLMAEARAEREARAAASLAAMAATIPNEIAALAAQRRPGGDATGVGP